MLPSTIKGGKSMSNTAIYIICAAMCLGAILLDYVVNVVIDKIERKDE